MDRKKALKQLRVLKKYGKSLRLAAEWSAGWKSLIATILSARTRDEKTIAVCNVLFKKYDLRKLAKARQTEIAKIIRSVNFYKTKSKNIIACAKELVEGHNGRVPEDFDKLLKLPGVGRKTANVYLAVKGNPAIGVDTHVFQTSRKLGWSNGKRPENVERDLERLFPRSRWRDVNYIVVRFGRSYSGKKKQKILDKVSLIR